MSRAFRTGFLLSGIVGMTSVSMVGNCLVDMVVLYFDVVRRHWHFECDVSEGRRPPTTRRMCQKGSRDRTWSRMMTECRRLR